MLDKLCFDYIRLLREEGPQRRLYRRAGPAQPRCSFAFARDGRSHQLRAGLANDMHYFTARMDVLRGNYLMDDYQRQTLSSATCLTSLPECRTTWCSVTSGRKRPARGSGVAYYATPYSLLRTLAGDEGAWRQLSIRDRLRSRPADCTCRRPTSSSPTMSRSNPWPVRGQSRRCRPWCWTGANLQLCGSARMIRVPGAQGVPSISSFRSPWPAPARGPTAAAAKLYVPCCSDAVNEFAYPALLAGLNFRPVQACTRPGTLKVSGYNDKQLVLARRAGSWRRLADAEPDLTKRVSMTISAPTWCAAWRTVKTARPFSQVMGRCAAGCCCTASGVTRPCI